ncbi:hypothetical protein OE88DRAFT_1625796 [Heliocybe sulcata]|uniref:Cryptic loci regulator 2 N-terminal domain-containing protein n=1 Tax=Heliocybe sulcata TaxID=5364 RepID=A0A5C3N6W6_9AGAM|nr:hypothetical protein OE88DRAFT_1625796 [Heliocybe sulcata]
MSGHRGLSGHHSLPENPSWIEITRSDGEPSRWHQNTTEVVDHEGHVNFMRPFDLDESTSVHWRKGLGMNIAKRLGMPDGPNYILKNWPDGYRFFDHNKGRQEAPRHDPYLIGSKHVNRFRSVPEFLPHALWLMQDPTLDKANCQCKYCSKGMQRPISESLGLSSPRVSRSVAHSQSPTPSSRVPKPPKPSKPQREGEARRPVPYTAVRKAPAPAKRAESHEPRQSMSRDRANDLAAVYSGIEPRRQHREGEMVWCALSTPIWGKTDLSSIYYWPGVIEDTRVKSDVVPLSDHEGANGTNGHNSMSHAANPEADQSHWAPPPPSWNIRQWFLHKVKLLGIGQELFTPEDMLLPYQAYVPPYDLLLALHETPLSLSDVAPEKIAAFNPCPPDASQNRVAYADAVPPYTLALQIASSLSNCWSPTDEWDFTMTAIPLDSPAHPKDSSLWPTWPPQNDIAGPSNVSPAELQSISAHMQGPSVLVSPGRPYTQTRYQGLWWGPERIWVDDLVRLKIARRQIAPQGTDLILPPSGPGPATQEYLAARKAEAEQGGMDVDLAVFPTHAIGAHGRGVLMKLQGLFVVELPSEGSKPKREIRASGMLYEFADEDWEDTNEKMGQPNVDKGKGKAKEVDETPMRMTPPAEQNGPSYMPGPSPLKPPPLPNPAPSVPLEDTAASVLNESLSSADAHAETSSNGHVQPPLMLASYPLPPAPLKYKFRPILPPGHEVVVSVSLIAGRYYPRIGTHPQAYANADRIRKASSDEAVFAYFNGISSLEGITPGLYNPVEPTYWKPKRLTMFRDADAEGRVDTDKQWQLKLQQFQDAMVVDS